jgi:ABC-type antimicrobial peptide transport system permease subunit
MSDRVAESLAQRKFSMVLAGMFAGLALVLAAIGTYGVMSYLVTQGVREIGIRIALGATPRAILKLVLVRGCELSVAGVVVGLAGAFALTRLLQSQVFGIGITDPLTFIAAVVILTAIALLASYVPARRAARVDAMVSLRNE